MIHSVACNTRDCPWYRRGSKCKHPGALRMDVAEHSKDVVPALCPLRHKADVLIASRSKDAVPISLLAMINGLINDLQDWKKLIRLAQENRRREQGEER